MFQQKEHNVMCIYQNRFSLSHRDSARIPHEGLLSPQTPYCGVQKFAKLYYAVCSDFFGMFQH